MTLKRDGGVVEWDVEMKLKYINKVALSQAERPKKIIPTIMRRMAIEIKRKFRVPEISPK